MVLNLIWERTGKFGAIFHGERLTILTIPPFRQYKGPCVQKMSTVAPVVYELWLIEVTYMILFVTSMTDSASKIQHFQIF